MSREADFATRMADATLAAILTGGVYQFGLAGLEGITRDATPAAFSGGYLLPCALVRQRGEIPDNIVSDEEAQLDSTVQIVEVYFYESRGYVAIDLAAARTYVLFKGYSFGDTFPLSLANVLGRQRDNGALNGASMERQDWQVNSILGG